MAPDPQAAPTYEVPDSDCPAGWVGLTVTTDSEAEVEYIDDIPACTNTSGDTTYLKNESVAVWTLRSASSGMATSVEQSLREASFIGAARQAAREEAILVPGDEVTVDLPPEDVEWVIDLPLSIGWEAHDVVLDKIRAGGEAAAVAALRRTSRAGGALAVCTLATIKYAETVSDLEDADASALLVSGLGVGAAGSSCRTEAASVPTVDRMGNQVYLADEVERLRVQSDLLAAVDTRITYAQRASRFMQFGLKFL